MSNSTESSTKRHGTLVVLCGDPLAAANRRPQLMAEFKQRFDRCVLLCPSVEIDSIKQLEQMGFEHLPISFVNQGINPLVDITLPLRIAQALRQLKADHLFTFHMKPILFGSLAVRLAPVRNTHFLFAGLGVLFADSTGWKRDLIRKCVSLGLKSGLNQATNLFFQNPDDQQLFLDHGIINSQSNSTVLNGSGVPLDDFACPPASAESPIEFTVITRMLRSKGIFDFCEAAKELTESRPGTAKFNLLGPLDNGPDGFVLEELKPWTDTGIVNYLGVTTDVRPYLSAASVIVLPSYYMEGTPRGLLESLASSRAIITTNSRGCRETVEDGNNGFLIDPKSPDQLADAMLQFIDHRELITEMGQASRDLAERRYDVRLVNAEMLTRMGL